MTPKTEDEKLDNAGTSSNSSIELVSINHNDHQQNHTIVPIVSPPVPPPPPPPPQPPAPPPPQPPHSEILEVEMMTRPSTSYGHAIPVDHHQKQHTVVPIPPPMPPPPNPPRLDLVQGSREEYVKVGVPLYKAAIKGDWKAAEPILKQNLDLVRFAITENWETLLHVAASAESTKAVEKFVMHLLLMMDPKDLELQNKSYNTAFALAAAAGNVKIAMRMVKKNPAVAEIPGSNRTMPLYMAALFAKPEMVRYLYGISKKMAGDYWSHDNRGWVLQKCVEAEIFDVAIKIVNDRPELLVEKGLLTDVLLALAQKTHAFIGVIPHMIFRIIKSVLGVFRVKVMPGAKESEALQLLRIIWGKVAIMPKSEIDDIIRGPLVVENTTRSYPSRILFVATKMGNTRFITELIQLYPDLIWKIDDKGKTIFHLAIKRRQADIYKLLYEIGGMKDLITPIKDNKGNNMLHMVAKKANKRKIQNLSGAALEMQRELLWYKEVEQIIPPKYRQRKNNAGETSQDLFAKKHEDLVSKGEEWTNNYMLVATLIATIVFAAAFTLPGGYDQRTGIPFFRKEQSLIVFVISDAVSLIFSSTSVLIFLSILTSRYVEHDFMDFLPSRLMFGIATLFLSIVTMMVAFSASFFVLYENKLKWVPFTVTCLAGIPVILFAKMQLKLLVDAFYFAYRSRHLFKSKKHILYH